MKTYNPDVLNCLANLSNDEVFTPPVLANQVLDMLPQELFCSPDTKFLDPVSKSGVFLREIVKRLDHGLQLIIPDRQQRIDHIMHNQVFGIATTELTSYISRRSLYCSREANSPYSVSHFDTAEGNIVYKNLHHTWHRGKCIYCGASQEVYDRSDADEHYAYQFIHTDNPQRLFPNMKFDVIIGNPPYQLSCATENSTSNNAAFASAIYPLFIETALKLNPKHLLMITPSRWMTKVGQGISEVWVNEMIQCNHFVEIHDFPNSTDCFAGVDIMGGVSYFHYEKDYIGKCNYYIHENDNVKHVCDYLNMFNTGIVIRDVMAIDIIKKIISIEGEEFASNSFSKHVSPGHFYDKKGL